MDHIQLFEKTKTAFVNHQNMGNRYHYSDTLKRDAVSLLKYYSAQILSRELGISSRSLKNWQESANHIEQASPAFVSLKLNEGTLQSSSTVLTESLILKLPHQLELILPIQSMKETVQLIASLIKEISLCSI